MERKPGDEKSPKRASGDGWRRILMFVNVFLALNVVGILIEVCSR